MAHSSLQGRCLKTKSIQLRDTKYWMTHSHPRIKRICEVTGAKYVTDCKLPLPPSTKTVIVTKKASKSSKDLEKSESKLPVYQVSNDIDPRGLTLNNICSSEIMDGSRPFQSVVDELQILYNHKELAASDMIKVNQVNAKGNFRVRTETGMTKVSLVVHYKGTPYDIDKGTVSFGLGQTVLESLQNAVDLAVASPCSRV